MSMFEIKNLFPRRWQASTSVMHGVDDAGNPQVLRVGDGGAITVKTATDDVVIVGGTSLNFQAVHNDSTDALEFRDTEGNPVSDTDGWVDVRKFTALSLSVSAAGTSNILGDDYTLGALGRVVLERKNHLSQPEGSEVEIRQENFNNNHVVILPDPDVNYIEIENAAWIRVRIENHSGGNFALYGIAK